MSKPSKAKLAASLAATLFTLLIVCIVIWVTAQAAMAKTPAEVTIIGTPSSHIAECEQYRAFAESVIAFRDGGGRLYEVHDYIDAQAKRVGWPSERAQLISRLVTVIWRQPDDAHQTGRRVFEACMKGRT